MNILIIMYSFGFAALFAVPVILILRRLIVTDMLKKLRGLTHEPLYNEHGNIVVIKNNFAEFAEFHAGVVNMPRGNLALSVLKRICRDIEDGKNYNSALYLNLYKSRLLEAALYLCIASHIPAFVSLIAAGYTGEYILVPMLILQVVWYGALGAFCRVLLARFVQFTEIFYTQWYGRLLDFTAVSVNALKQKLLAESTSAAHEALQITLHELRDVYAAQSEALSAANRELAGQLQALAEAKAKNELVSAETVLASLDANFNRITELCAALDTAAKKQGNLYEEVFNFIGNNDTAIKAINKLAGEFAKLRNELSGYASTAKNAAVKKLISVSNDMETNINKTFITIDETMQRNAKDLFESYERFFKITNALLVKNNEGDHDNA